MEEAISDARKTQNTATPIIEGQTVRYTGQSRGMRAVKIEKQNSGFTAKELWSNRDFGTAFTTPLLKDGLLFGLSHRRKLFCLNAKTGHAAWTDTTNRQRFCAILDAGQVVLALDSSATLVVFKPSEREYSELAAIKRHPDPRPPRGRGEHDFRKRSGDGSLVDD